MGAMRYHATTSCSFQRVISRIRLQFSVRALLAAAALLSVLLAREGNRIAREQAAIKTLTDLGLPVVIGSTAPEWLPQALDGPWFQRVLAVNVAERDSKRAKAGVEIYPPRYHADRGISNIEMYFLIEPCQNRGVRRRQPIAPQVTDEVLAAVAGMSDCHALALAQARLSDAGLKYLRQMPRLRYLDLADTAISDASVEDLMRLPNLTFLKVTGTNISHAGLARLRTALPDCQIIR